MKRPNDLEQKIINARLTGLSFNQIDEKYIQSYVDEIMLKGAAISGCSLPGTDYFAQKISEEIIVYITQYGYEELTIEEILTALRLNAKANMKHPSTGNYLEPATFTGNCFNITYLAKALENYMLQRLFLDRKFQNIIDGY